MQRNRPVLVLVLAAAAFLVPIPAQAQVATKLNIVRRVKVGSTDLRSVRSWATYNGFPVNQGQGQTYYVAADAGSSRTPFYALYASPIDHMDSLASNEGGYALVDTLGFAYTTSSPLAVSQMRRAFNIGLPDHGTFTTWEGIPGGYSIENFGVYGYSRYGTGWESLLTTTAGGVEFQSNGVAGGSGWNWRWNAKNFINHNDFGRQMQSSVVWNCAGEGYPGPIIPYVGNRNCSGVACPGDEFPAGCMNPTEAGDLHSPNPWFPNQSTGLTTRAEYSHGSPVLNIHQVAAVPPHGPTQVTRGIPLEWDPSGDGGGPDNPILWRDMALGKEITMNFDGLGPVARYITTLTFPNAASYTNAQIEIPSIYLNGFLNRFWTFDAVTNQLTERSVPPGGVLAYSMPGGPGTVTTWSGKGGVIISSQANDFAMGIYGVHPDFGGVGQGGSTTYFTFFNFTQGPPAGPLTDDPNDPRCTKINAAYHPGYRQNPTFLLPSGNSQYTSYVISGTRDAVVNTMIALRDRGWK